MNDELRFGKDGFPLDSESRVESRSDSKKSEVVLQFDELFVDSIAVDASLKFFALKIILVYRCDTFIKASFVRTSFMSFLISWSCSADNAALMF